MTIARRVIVVAVVALLVAAMAMLWWRHGVGVFLSSLGSMIC